MGGKKKPKEYQVEATNEKTQAETFTLLFKFPCQSRVVAHKTKKWNIKVKKTKQTEKIGGKMDRPKNKKK